MGPGQVRDTGGAVRWVRCVADSHAHGLRLVAHGVRFTVSRWAQAAGDSHKLRTDSIRLHGRNHQPARAQTQHRRGLIQIAQPLALAGSLLSKNQTLGP